MAWTRIIQTLKEGQFVRLNSEMTMSSFRKETSINNAAYSLMYGDLHDYQRNDTVIKANSVGKIVSPCSSIDGCYSVRFESVVQQTSNELNPDYFFKGTGLKVKIMKKVLLEDAEVWVD